MGNNLTDVNPSEEENLEMQSDSKDDETADDENSKNEEISKAQTKCSEDDKITLLSNKIYITRRCRIKASERFKKYDSIILGLNVWYSIWLIIISVICLSPNIKSENLNLNFISMTTSILVFAFSMLATSLNFKDKYYMFKNCYLQLDLLSHKLDNIDKNDKDLGSKYDEISNEYNCILSSTDNHSDIDLQNYILCDPWAQERYKNLYDYGILKLKINIRNIIYKLGVIILAAAPILIPRIISLLSLWMATL